MNTLDQRLMDSVIYRKVAPLLLTAALVLAIAAIAGTYVNGRADARRNSAQIEEAAHNAIVACENANESRAAGRTLWNYVLDISVARQPDDTSPDQVAYLNDFRAWVNRVYAPHDCTDLAQKYPLPSPPPVPANP